MRIAQGRQDGFGPFGPQADECPVGWSHGLTDVWVAIGKTFLETLLEHREAIAFLEDMLVLSVLTDEGLEPSSGELSRLNILVLASRQNELHEMNIVGNIGNENGSSLIGLVCANLLCAGTQFHEMRKNKLSNVVDVGNLGLGHFLDEVTSILGDGGSLRKH